MKCVFIDILKKFNEMSQEGITVDSSMLDEEITKDLIAKDGNLPGGMDVDMMKALASDPEILTMLKDKKMQDIMSAIMTQGPDAMKKVGCSLPQLTSRITNRCFVNWLTAPLPTFSNVKVSFRSW